MDREVAQLKGDYTALLEQLGREFPTVKRVLLDERNEHMAARLAALRAEGRERIVAVVGDGHVEGLQALLAAKQLGHEVEVVRLRELQAAEPTGTASYSFSAQVDGGP